MLFEIEVRVADEVEQNLDDVELGENLDVVFLLGLRLHVGFLFWIRLTLAVQLETAALFLNEVIFLVVIKVLEKLDQKTYHLQNQTELRLPLVLDEVREHAGQEGQQLLEKLFQS